MNKHSLKILAALAALVLAGCATIPQVFVVVSPHYQAAQIRRVALIGFADYPGMYGSGESAAGIFEKYLLLAGYSLVERRQVSEVLKEQSLQANGFYDQATLQKLGKILGVNALVFGSINDYANPHQETVMVNMPQEQSSPVYGQVETIQKQGDTVYKSTQSVVTDYSTSWTYQVVPQTEHIPAHAGLSVRLVNVENGEVLWSASSSSEGYFLNEATERASSQIMQTVAKQLFSRPQ
jgi:hypothetical protein